MLSGGNSPKFYIVVPPQRRYRWKAIQVKELWDDILKARKNSAGKEVYFVGTIFLLRLKGTKASHHVIDGQQRLTTLSLMIAVLRDICLLHDDLIERASFLNKHIDDTDPDGNSRGHVLTLQPQDDTTYQHWVSGNQSTINPAPKPKTAEYKSNIFQAVKKLRELVADHLAISGINESDELKSLSDYLTGKVTLLPIIVEKAQHADQIFDTTNTRGLRLDIHEQVKASVAIEIRNDSILSDAFNKIWNTAATKLENNDLDPKAMDNYLLTLWAARFGHESVGKLRGLFTGKFKEEGKCNDSCECKENCECKVGNEDCEHKLDYKEFITDIGSYIDSYVSVRNPSDHTDTSEDLLDLSRMGVIQAFPLLTAVHKHANDRFVEAVAAVLTLHTRVMIIGNKQANFFPTEWLNWTRDVCKGKIGPVLDDIISRLPSDSEFLETFLSNGIVNQAGAARHMLRRLDLVVSYASGVHIHEVDVEHILPKSVSTKLTNESNLGPDQLSWLSSLGHLPLPSTPQGQRKLGETIVGYTNKLGNIALLHQTPNRAAKDKPLQAKLLGYSEMKLTLSNEIASETKWTNEEIDKRHQRLSELIVQAWPKALT